MSKFFVHQRIRKARGAEAIGMEGTVVTLGQGSEPRFNMTVRIDNDVRITGWWVAKAGTVLEAIQDQWEPAIGPDEQGVEEDKRIEETV